jgi:hypothetical protein
MSRLKEFIAAKRRGIESELDDAVRQEKTATQAAVGGVSALCMSESLSEGGIEVFAVCMAL